MFSVVVAALSLASSLTIQVPYLAQTEALCGGAAAAMVFRYWGDAHADVQEFASLVDRRAGGIADGALVEAVRARGWLVFTPDGSVAELKRRLEHRQPVIVLVADRGDRSHRAYHYVVVIGATANAIVVHDPAWGPSRAIGNDEFDRIWRAANFWSLVILPPLAGPVSSTPAVAPTTPNGSVNPGECDTLLDHAVAEIRDRGLSEADSILGTVRERCPASAGAFRELAGVRFAQRRWNDAAHLSREALDRDPRDAYATDLLGSSLFMQDDPAGALRAWNRVAKPRVNLVRIDGIRHARYQAIADALEIRPNMLLTANAFERARRRLDEWPDRSTARLAMRPEADGFADVDIVVAERAALPHGPLEWVTTGVRAGVDREMTVSAPGFTGQGETWSASWRWWSNRPAYSVGFAAPRVGGLPGVWRFDGGWQSQAYAQPASDHAAPLLREARTHGGLTVSDWWNGATRYAVSAGIDAWDARKAASIGGSIERRWIGDRVSVTANGSRWMSLDGGAGFDSIGARATLRSSTGTRGWIIRGATGVERVSDAAPFGLWPGAGDGHAREPLLRAHPLLDAGVIDLDGSSAFGRTLSFATAEVQRWFDAPSILRIGIAGFADIARASRQFVAGPGSAQLDLGTGLRIKLPGTDGVLRVDVARGVRDGRNALTVGWQF